MNLNQILINSLESLKKEKKKIVIKKKLPENNEYPRELKTLEYQLNLYNKNKNKHKDDVPKINLVEEKQNTSIDEISTLLTEKNKLKKTKNKVLTMSEKWTLIKNFLNDKKINDLKLYKNSFLKKTLKVYYDKDGNIENIEL